MRTVLVLALLVSVGSAQGPADDWQVVVLGIAQDGGIPQLGCRRPICEEIRAGKRKPEKVSSLGLINRRTGAAYVFDATPDFPAQVQALMAQRERAHAASAFEGLWRSAQ